MANYKQVGYGSQGSDVTELQKLLNQNGYNLTEDGIFGKNTQAAVKDYQQKNNLAVDGIVGTNTWGALTKASAPATPEAPKAPSFEYTPYTPSDTVKQAEALLQQQLANKPGSYTSPWQSQLNDIIQQIQNREKFSYDLNADALYQQYKDQYTTQGKMAMMDTMGQAQAMTGGYGNSYAQRVGQQAYQGHLQQLNDRIPELYQLALNQYNKEGDDMYNQASLIAGMEEQDYGRYRDSVSDYYTELDRLTNDSRYQAEQDYGKWADNQSFGYQQYRDQVADQQWQAQFDEAKRQYDEQMALTKGKTSNGGNDDNDYDDPGNPGYDNEGLSEAQIKTLQKALGLTEDGKWGPASREAAGGLGAKDAFNAWKQGKLGQRAPFEDDGKLTYSDVALTAAQMRKAGASKQEINQYLNEVVQGSNYTPTNSVAKDLMELKAGYVGSGR